MALTVEDGTAKSDADSYISRAAADIYHEQRANGAWDDLSSTQKDAALRYATTTLDGMYEWDGEVTTGTQALGWPRLGAEDAEERTIDSDEVPTRVQHATCELALLHATSALNASHERGGAIRREKVGPLETEYEPGAAVESWLPILDRMLGGLGARRSWLSRDPGRG